MDVKKVKLSKNQVIGDRVFFSGDCFYITDIMRDELERMHLSSVVSHKQADIECQYFDGYDSEGIKVFTCRFVSEAFTNRDQLFLKGE